MILLFLLLAREDRQECDEIWHRLNVDVQILRVRQRRPDVTRQLAGKNGGHLVEVRTVLGQLVAHLRAGGAEKK